jgi:hypothetical protein
LIDRIPDDPAQTDLNISYKLRNVNILTIWFVHNHIQD